MTAQADEAGARSDSLPPGEIDILVDPIPYMKEVTNISESTGGTDVEGDDSLTRRIYLAPSAFLWPAHKMPTNTMLQAGGQT